MAIFIPGVGTLTASGSVIKPGGVVPKPGVAPAASTQVATPLAAATVAPAAKPAAPAATPAAPAAKAESPANPPATSAPPSAAAPPASAAASNREKPLNQFDKIADTASGDKSTPRTTEEMLESGRLTKEQIDKASLPKVAEMITFPEGTSQEVQNEITLLLQRFVLDGYIRGVDVPGRIKDQGGITLNVQGGGPIGGEADTGGGVKVALTGWDKMDDAWKLSDFYHEVGHNALDRGHNPSPASMMRDVNGDTFGDLVAPYDSEDLYGKGFMDNWDYMMGELYNPDKWGKMNDANQAVVPMPDNYHIIGATPPQPGPGETRPPVPPGAGPSEKTKPTSGPTSQDPQTSEPSPTSEPQTTGQNTTNTTTLPPGQDQTYTPQTTGVPYSMTPRPQPQSPTTGYPTNYTPSTNGPGPIGYAPGPNGNVQPVQPNYTTGDYGDGSYSPSPGPQRLGGSAEAPDGGDYEMPESEAAAAQYSSVDPSGQSGLALAPARNRGGRNPNSFENELQKMLQGAGPLLQQLGGALLKR